MNQDTRMASIKGYLKGLRNISRKEKKVFLNLIEEVDRKDQEWKEKYPDTFNSPWSYFSFDNLHVDDNNVLRIWLNPANQQYINFGWLNANDILRWINLTPGFVKEPEVLKWKCKRNINSFILYHIEQDDFNLYKPDFGASEQMPRIMEKLAQNKELDEDIISVIERFWKAQYYRACTQTFPMEDERKYFLEIDDEAFSFFRTLKWLGIGKFQAVNTPTIRTNLSWWREVIRNEALFEYQIQIRRGEFPKKIIDYIESKGREL
jgi:hypothetical protein